MKKKRTNEQTKISIQSIQMARVFHLIRILHRLLQCNIHLISNDHKRTQTHMHFCTVSIECCYYCTDIFNEIKHELNKT